MVTISQKAIATVKQLNDKLFGLNELEVRVEFQLAKAICNALREKEDAGVEFLSRCR